MKLQVIGQMIAFTERETLVSGTVNKYRAEFVFDDSWEGYTKTAVFRADSFGSITSREVLLAGDACQVPHECLIAGALLRVGVYGISGDITTPTIYTQEPIGVARGAEPAESTQDPTPGVYQQIINIIEAGAITGPAGPQGPKGDAGDTGPQGPAGVGVPSGGTAGQILSKTADGTAWTDPPSGGVTSWNDLQDKPFVIVGIELDYASNVTSCNFSYDELINFYRNGKILIGNFSVSVSGQKSNIGQIACTHETGSAIVFHAFTGLSGSNFVEIVYKSDGTIEIVNDTKFNSLTITSASGLILPSGTGKKFSITVDDTGAVTTTEVT